jgi:hypothetical protein
VETLCPKCKREIPWHKLRGEMSCPHCNASLSARTLGPVVAAIVLWTLADIPIKLFIYGTLGDSGIGLLSRIVASGLVGWVILHLIVGGFAKVEERPLSNNSLEADREA